MLDSNVNERMRKILGANLRLLRQSRGYSQFKFAELVGVTQAAISAWELGKSRSTADATADVC